MQGVRLKWSSKSLRDRKAQPWRSGNFKNLHWSFPGQESAQQGNGAESQEGQGSLQIPGVAIRGGAWGAGKLTTNCELILLKAWSATAPGHLGEANPSVRQAVAGHRWLNPVPWEEMVPRSSGPAAQGPGSEGAQAGKAVILCSPWDRQKSEGTRQLEFYSHWAPQSCAGQCTCTYTRPGASRPLQNGRLH